MNGGTMVAMGSSGMMQSISDTSKQYGNTQVFGEGEDCIQKGDIIKIQDGNETILEIVAQKDVVNHSMEGGMRPQRREAVADF